MSYSSILSHTQMLKNKYAYQYTNEWMNGPKELSLAHARTLALMEYSTKESRVVTLRWRMERRTEWKEATILESCRTRLRERIRMLAWVSIRVTSISAMAALLWDEYLLPNWLWEQLNWGYAKNWVNGVVVPKNCLLSSSVFWGVGEAWLWTRPPLLSSCPFPFTSNAYFLASSDCKMCSSSFTNSMAPPTIEAWSPYKIQHSSPLRNIISFLLDNK